MTERVKPGEVVSGHLWKARPGLRVCLHRPGVWLHQPLKRSVMYRSSWQVGRVQIRDQDKSQEEEMGTLPAMWYKVQDTHPHGGWGGGVPGKGAIQGGSRTGLHLFTTLQKLQCERFHNPYRPLGLCQRHRLNVMNRLSDTWRKSEVGPVRLKWKHGWSHAWFDILSFLSGFRLSPYVERAGIAPLVSICFIIFLQLLDKHIQMFLFLVSNNVNSNLKEKRKKQRKLKYRKYSVHWILYC